MNIHSLKSTKNSSGFWCWFVMGSALNHYDILKTDNDIFGAFILLFCVSFYRLGYTYLRLKDNYMEILNRENNIEK